MNVKIDPLASCLVCVMSDPPLERKHAVVIFDIPLCHTHAEDVMTIALTGKGELR